jgi:hypothetical protein
MPAFAGRTGVHELAGQFFLPSPAARLSTTGLNLFQSLAASGEFLLDRFDRSRPHKRSGMFVPRRQEFRDRLLQVPDTVERAPTHALGGQFGKPALNEIEPTGTGRYKVRDEARMLPEPGSHFGMLVRAVVIHHQVQRHGAWKFLIQTAQKLQKLLVPVALEALLCAPV